MYIRPFSGLNIAPTTVVPMPWYSRERVDLSKIWRLATRIPVSRRFSSSLRLVSKWKGQVTSSLAVLRKNSEMVSVAMRDATSPARWPPMPSATTKRSYSLSTTNESSLCSRWSPTSLSPAASARIKAPNPPTKEFHPPRGVSSESSVGRSVSDRDLGHGLGHGLSLDNVTHLHLENVFFFVRDGRVDLLDGVLHRFFDLFLATID